MVPGLVLQKGKQPPFRSWLCFSRQYRSSSSPPHPPPRLRAHQGKLTPPSLVSGFDYPHSSRKMVKKQDGKGSPGMPVAALPGDTQLVELTTLASLGKWIISARVLQKFGCRGFQVISG